MPLVVKSRSERPLKETSRESFSRKIDPVPSSCATAQLLFLANLNGGQYSRWEVQWQVADAHAVMPLVIPPGRLIQSSEREEKPNPLFEQVGFRAMIVPFGPHCCAFGQHVVQLLISVRCARRRTICLLLLRSLSPYTHNRGNERRTLSSPWDRSILGI